jgi:hypothetical protein
VHGSRESIDFGGITEDWRPETLFDNPVVLDVEIAKEPAQPDRRYQEDDQRCPEHGVTGETAPRFAGFVSAFRDLYLDSQYLDSRF